MACNCENCNVEMDSYAYRRLDGLCLTCYRDEQADNWDADEMAGGCDEVEPAMEYDDSMDGDHESGLASAGWGTDEDYNHYDYGCYEE